MVKLANVDKLYVIKQLEKMFPNLKGKFYFVKDYSYDRFLVFPINEKISEDREVLLAEGMSGNIYGVYDNKYKNFYSEVFFNK